MLLDQLFQGQTFALATSLAVAVLELILPEKRPDIEELQLTCDFPGWSRRTGVTRVGIVRYRLRITQVELFQCEGNCIDKFDAIDCVGFPQRLCLTLVDAIPDTDIRQPVIIAGLKTQQNLGGRERFRLGVGCDKLQPRWLVSHDIDVQNGCVFDAILSKCLDRQVDRRRGGRERETHLPLLDAGRDRLGIA